MSEHTQVLVIGGGPAGMIAAITAARRGRQVVLLEGNGRVGKKLLSTGNGKCNFTNEHLDASDYHAGENSLVDSVISRFDNQALIRWFTGAGIEPLVRDGRVYPRSEQAASVLDALRLQLELSGVCLHAQSKVMTLRKKGSVFEVQTVDAGYTADAVILACGSKAAPGTGSDGSGYRLAEQMDLTLVHPLPALTSLKLAVDYTKSWAGVRCDGTVRLTSEGEEIARASGQLQMTGTGISGIPVFQVSRFASRLMDEGKAVTAHLSLIEGQESVTVSELLRTRAAHIGEYPVSDFLLGFFPKNLAGVLIRLAGWQRRKKCSELTADEIDRMAGLITDLQVPVAGTGSFEQAQVCTGGVSLEQLDPGTMGCRDIPGLYLAGEIVDVDGLCGGYNLQWAFSSGHLAGSFA